MIWRNVLVTTLVLAVGTPPAAASWWLPWRRKRECANVIEARPVPVLRGAGQTPADALRTIYDKLPYLIATWKPEARPSWMTTFYEYIWPYIQWRSSKLAIAIVGPANVGKSLVFNSIPRLYEVASAQTPTSGPDPTISPAGPEAVLTTEAHFLVQSRLYGDGVAFAARFGHPEQWTNGVHYEWGNLLQSRESVFPDLIFIDSPGLDVQDLSPIAERVSNLADVLVYVFSGANYMNDSNLAYLRDQFRNSGQRQVILVYRANAGVDPTQAKRDFANVARAIFPDSPVDEARGLPDSVLGTYIMPELPEVSTGLQPPEFIPVGDSEDLPKLLQRLDANAAQFRARALASSMPVVLDGIADALHQIERNHEEWDLLRRGFDLMIDNNVLQFNQPARYRRLGSDLVRVWYNRSGGLRNIVQWVGRPIHMLRGPRASLGSDNAALQDLYAEVDGMISDVTASVQLGAVQYITRLPSSQPGVKKLEESVAEFRQAYSLGPQEAPYVVHSGDTVEFHWSNREPLRSAMQAHFQRDWPAIIANAKTQAHNQLADLTAHLQTDFKQAVNFRSIPGEVGRSALLALATVPPIVAFAYIVGSSVPIMDVRTVLSLVGASLLTRGIVWLDEKSLTLDWDRHIQQWYVSQHGPKLNDILHKSLEPANPFPGSADRADLEQLQAAVEILSRKPMRLDLRDDPKLPAVAGK